LLGEFRSPKMKGNRPCENRSNEVSSTRKLQIWSSLTLFFLNSNTQSISYNS
jgi:hypothetical protein